MKQRVLFGRSTFYPIKSFFYILLYQITTVRHVKLCRGNFNCIRVSPMHIFVGIKHGMADKSLLILGNSKLCPHHLQLLLVWWTITQIWKITGLLELLVFTFIILIKICLSSYFHYSRITEGACRFLLKGR